MPKRLHRNKKYVPASEPSPAYGKGRSFNVKDLLASSAFSLTKSQQYIDEKQILLNQVRALIPEGLRDRVAAATLEAGELTLFCASAAWAARLRFAVAELEPAALTELGGAGIHAVVRVRPGRG